jgi:integrase
VATVRKRTWTSKGTVQTAWNVDYKDAQGNRRFETFKLKRQADARLTVIQAELAKGVHTPTATSQTLKEAAERWYSLGLAKNERATQANYRHYLDAFILPTLGRHKLSALTKPGIFLFRDHLLQQGTSDATTNKVLIALKGILATAEQYGLVSQNVASRVTVGKSDRDKERLEIGRSIPTKDEIRGLIDAASEGKWRTFLIVLSFCGLRASEARGLTWDAVDLDARTITIRQRADRYQQIGAPKSKAGQRDIPLGPLTANVLKQWRLRQKPTESGLVFPSQADTPLWHSAIVNDHWRPLQRKAGVVDGDGEPKYGLHALRHFAASHWIDLDFAPKKVQEMMGHSSIVITLDRYSHLFKNPEADQERLAKGELSILG